MNTSDLKLRAGIALENGLITKAEHDIAISAIENLKHKEHATIGLEKGIITQNEHDILLASIGLANGTITQLEHDTLLASLAPNISQIEIESREEIEEDSEESEMNSEEELQNATNITPYSADNSIENISENNYNTTNTIKPNILSSKNAKHKPTVFRKNEKTTLFVIILAVAFIGIFASAFFTNGITGFASLNIPDQNYTNNTIINISQEVTSIKVTGFLYGDGTATIYYKTNNSALLIGTITSNDGLPRTIKASYAPGEEVNIENVPSSYNAYLDDGTNNVQTAIPFIAPNQSMTLLIVANDTTNLRTYRVPIIIGDTPRTTVFTNVCVDTCEIPASTGEITIVTTEGTHITFNHIETTLPQNNPPVLVSSFDPITINQTTTINLGEHFIDIDGDTRYYSTENSNIANLTVENNILTITPIQEGTQIITIYASDLKEIASGKLELTVAGIITPQINNNNTLPTAEINNTTNTTPEINTTIIDNTNITINETINNTTQIINTTNNDSILQVIPTTLNDTFNNSVATNITINDTTLDCSNPDPNARPVACLYLDIPEYFPDQEILLENRDREVVARFTSIGNLLIRGDIVEYSTGSPGNRDWRVATVDRDGNEHATVWIDSTTGDLHLTGSVIEENTNLDPPMGSYSLINKRSIYLAWADTTSGTLHVRGNIIPYKRTLSLTRNTGGGTV